MEELVILRDSTCILDKDNLRRDERLLDMILWLLYRKMELSILS